MEQRRAFLKFLIGNDTYPEVPLANASGGDVVGASPRIVTTSS